MKSFVRAFIVSAAVVAGANAYAAFNPHAFVQLSSDVIATMFKTGRAKASELTTLTFWGRGGGPTKHAFLGTLSRSGKKDIHVFLSRVNKETEGFSQLKDIDVIKINLVTEMDDQTFKSVDMGGSGFMHGDPGDVANAALASSGLKEEGLAVMTALNQSGVQVTSLSEYLQKIQMVRQAGGTIAPTRGILMDQTLSREFTSGLRSLDLHVVNSVADGGPGMAFEIRLAISNSTTAEELGRLFEVILNGRSVAF